MSRLPILVLAAGQSSRMRGSDKLMEKVDGQPLVRRQADMARRVTKGPVIVALPPLPHARHDALAEAQVTRLIVPDAAEGMGASLRAAFAALPPDAPAAMVLPGDMPDLTDADLQTVLDAADPGSGDVVWRATTETGRRGHPLVFAAELFPAFAGLHGDQGARCIVDMAGSRIVYVALPGQRACLDLDTPEEWAAWRARRGR